MGKRKNNNKNFATQHSVDQVVKSICDIMRRGNCAGALQYVPELTWILFLRILDEQEEREKQEAEAVGVHFAPSLESPYRWKDWAAPPLFADQGWKRKELQEGALGSFFSFVNEDLLPYLKALKSMPAATPRQKVISEIMTGVERVRIDTERNFLDVLDKVHDISAETVDPTHVFTLSQVYEGLLLKMGEKGNDGGQFFTPREVIRAMIRVIDPKIDETVYDPGCGTGGFLAQSFAYIRENLDNNVTSDQLEILKERAFWGREKENLIYPIALANLVLHGIDRPNLWHGNTLTGQEIYVGLFEGAPPMFDVILTDIKVREKTLLTLKHFDNFFKLLHTRADSELSWTVDLDEHKKRAADNARQFNEKARQEFQEAAQGKERLKELKKTKSKDEKDIQEAKTCFDMNEI